LQGEFTCEVLRVCKNRGIGTAVETCGHAPWESIEVSLEHIDILFFDIKHVDNLVHREWTGAGNELIKENLLRIDGHDSTPELVIRIPFIPGFNGGEKTIREILSLVQGLKKIAFVEILPYHRLGWGKYEALGRGYSLKELAPVKRDSLTDIVAAGADYGLEVRIA
jgi:pyruvate formate lyase activating enzyme